MDLRSFSYLVGKRLPVFLRIHDGLSGRLGRNFMDDFRVLIPAAGLGTRAGLPYPKTLYPVDGTPILHRLLATRHLRCHTYSYSQPSR